MRVSFEDLVIIDQWAMYSRLLDLLDPHLEQVLQDWQQEVEQQAEGIEDEDTRNEFYEFHSEEYHEQMEFRVILMNALFVSSFASFEHQLMWICHFAERNSGSPSSVEDLRSPPSIKEAKTYLKGLGIEFPSDSQEWQNITTYQKIRNQIMHKGARLAGVEEHVAEFAMKKDISHSGSFELTRTFCDEAGRDMKQLLVEVYRAYERWRKSDK